MADIRNNPHFVLFPINNNRTGYQPFALPVLYVEPRRIDENGNGIADTEALAVRYYVVDAPDPARVNGPFNQNLRIPDESLFEIQLSAVDLTTRQLDLRGLRFFGQDGIEKSFVDAEEGDTFEYTMRGPIAGSTPTSTTVYYPDAYYYDVSDIAINPDQLPRPKRYFFVWESIFFRRLPTATGDFKCLASDQGLAQLIFDVNHPGDVHEHMFRLTPMLYFDFENNNIQDDPTLKFYRPFADILQDLFDEQNFLDGVNQIDTIPAEYIPYLAFLIGVDLPNFPGTTDNLRRSILRRGAGLQKLKSSRRVLVELFDMFGFVVDIINLHASVDGNCYLAPNDGLDTQLVTQTDIVLSDFAAAGFGVGEVPFVYRPRRDSQVALHAWIVEDGSVKYQELLAISDGLSSDLESENIDGTSVNVNGILEPSFVSDIGIAPQNGIIGYSTVVVGDTDGSMGRPVLNSNNIIYNRTTNTLNLFFDHELSVDRNAKVFVFASYERLKINIPSQLSNTRTNKFDVEFISRQDITIDFNLLQFLLDFVFNLKGFHSLLRKIKVPIECFDVYNVIDTCVDGKDPFEPGTDLGDLQSPPAIIPIDPSCQEDGERGFNNSDLILRNLILEGLEHEFQAWKALSPDDCALTPEGQDKVVDDGVVESVTDVDLPDYDHELDDRETLCGTNPQKLDYCYKGRVQDNLSQILTIPVVDRYRCNPCGPGMGNVVYWEEHPNKSDLDGQNRGLLRQRIVRRAGRVSLHYTDQPFFDQLANNTLAIAPININIEKDNLGFPSHKFLSMNALESDYNYTDTAVADGCLEFDEARQRPWDELSQCGFPDLLNAQLITKTDGDQELTWDSQDLVYSGNGLIPDIPSLSDHGDVSDGRIITHKIYQSSGPGHPSLTFESTVFTDSDSIDTESVVTGPIFDSNCDTANEDFIGGYPAVVGLTTTDKETFVNGGSSDEFTFCDEGTVGTSIGILDREAIAKALCIDFSESTSTEARFFGNSMEHIQSSDVLYRFFVPYRLDCACLNSSCGTNDPTGVDGVSCNQSVLYDKDGNFDPDCDKLEVDLAIALRETMTLCDRLTNNDLANLFCLNDSCATPESGEFRFQDDYGIIYEVDWIFMEDTMDITVVTKDPRVPGEESDGYVESSKGSFKIFRKGVISTVRKIIKIDSLGDVIIDAEGSEVVVGFFQTNVTCGDQQFDAPFSYGVDCALQANVAALTTDGPHWVSSTDEPTSPTFGFSILAEDEASSKTIYKWGDPENPQDDDLFWTDPLEAFIPEDVQSPSSDSTNESSSSS